MKKQTITFASCVLVLLLLATSAHAQCSFRTEELKRLVSTLKIDPKSLEEGENYQSVNGIGMIIRVKGNVIDHVGMRVFSSDLRKLDNSPIFDFLERYFLQLKYPPVVKTAQNMIRDDQFNFIKGSIHTINELQPTDEFSYHFDRHRYTASWTRNGKDILSVSFPVEYELISGENKIEAENHLAFDIQKTPEKANGRNARRISDNQYITSDFSNRLYYIDGELVASEYHPAESAANMMLSTEASGEYRLHLTQISYGFKKTEFEVPLKQWITFCENSGCQLYFGIEDFDGSEFVDAVVIAVNSTENYNHVLTVKIPTEAIANQQGVIHARMYPYVPTHNVANLFSSYRKSNPKTFVNK